MPGTYYIDGPLIVESNTIIEGCTFVVSGDAPTIQYAVGAKDSYIANCIFKRLTPAEAYERAVEVLGEDYFA